MPTLRFCDPTTECSTVGPSWMTPSRLRPLFYNDPALVWLEHHGAANGFTPDQPAYSMIKLLETKGRQFEAAWMARLAPEAVRVCAHPGEAREASAVQRTLALMDQGAAVIAQPALWWPQAQLYGVPDLLVRADWLRDRFPQLATHLLRCTDEYLIIDIKFTSRLQSRSDDFHYYQAQVRLYSFMLGQLQGHMPPYAFLATRDTLTEPLVVAINSTLDGPLDPDLAHHCATYQTIVRDGAGLRPWRDTDVAPNYSYSDERWSSAKAAIMRRVPGGAVEQLWYVGYQGRCKLHAAGIRSLEQLLNTDPAELPKGVLKRQAGMLAIMEANRSQQARRAATAVPATHAFELMIDCEFFNSLNADCEREWPELKGTPMIFMLGVGWLTSAGWQYQDFVAEAETHAAERHMLDQFAAFVMAHTGGDLRRCAVYHWSSADRTQAEQAAERHQLAADHPLRCLVWDDLEKRLREETCAIPGAWNYGLKSVVRALAAQDASFDPGWPSDLDDGGLAQVMGWQAYQCPQPLATDEMELLRRYLEADCRAVYHVLRWLRS